MKTLRNISIVLFLGFSIVVGLNLELFIEKTSNIIYVVSGEQARDLKEQEEIARRNEETIAKRKLHTHTVNIEKGLDNFTKYEEDILQGMDLLVTQEKLNELFPLKVSSEMKDSITDDDGTGTIYENMCIGDKYYNRYNRDTITIKNNSSVAVESLRIRFMAYNEEKNLTYVYREEGYYFEYFLEPGDSQLKSCDFLSITPKDYESLKSKNAIFKYEVIETNEHKPGTLPSKSKIPCESYEGLLYLNERVISSNYKMERIKENYPELYERIPEGGFKLKQNLLDFCSKY